MKMGIPDLGLYFASSVNFDPYGPLWAVLGVRDCNKLKKKPVIKYVRNIPSIFKSLDLRFK